MEKKPMRKLELKKKTISKLSQNQVQFGADSWTTISVVTGGCITDFTRTSISISIHTGH